MKKICAGLMVLSLVAMLAGCGHNTADTPVEKEVDSSKVQTSSSESISETSSIEMVSETPEQESEPPMSETSGERTSSASADKNLPIESYFGMATELSAGTSYTADGVIELSFSEISWKDEIIPDNPGAAYLYYEDQEEYTYLVCRGTAKNIGAGEIRLGVPTPPTNSTNYVCLSEYAGEYYVGGIQFGTEQNDDITSFLNTDKEVPVYLYFSIPDKNIVSDSSVSVLIGFDDFKFEEKLYSTGSGSQTIKWDKCTHLLKVDFDSVQEKTETLS